MIYELYSGCILSSAAITITVSVTVITVSITAVHVAYFRTNTSHTPHVDSTDVC